MAEIDRLSTLIDRFHLTVTPAPATRANLAVETGEGGCRITFLPRGEGVAQSDGHLTAHVAFGGEANPLLAALPERVEADLAEDAGLRAVAEVMQAEMAGQRCGAPMVLNRLGEVIFVRLMRHLIERGATASGVLGGLADPRLSRAIVAIHDKPGHAWSAEELAAEAGLSRSRFAELFHSVVGESPGSYLRRWRLVMARQDMARGHRVDRIARRYGYGSPDGFARAFRREFGQSPSALRPGP